MDDCIILDPDQPYTILSYTSEQTPREAWGDGPWLEEPAYYRFTDITGITCIIMRHYTLGHLCGYIQMPKGHPFAFSRELNMRYNVHGGITYEKSESPASDGKEDDAILRTWIGFDCAHSDDISPQMTQFMKGRSSFSGNLFEGQQYRTFEYVKRELRSLCDQVIEDGKPNKPNPPLTFNDDIA